MSLFVFLGLLVGAAVVKPCAAAEEAWDKPAEESTIDVPVEEVKKTLKGEDSVGSAIKIFVIMTLLSFLPAVLVMMTSFTRIVIVLSFLRQALATQQTPPNLVLIGLAFFLTTFIMSPVWTKVYEDAYQPFMKDKITQEEAFEKGMAPFRQFMGRQTRKKDLGLMIRMSNQKRPESFEEIPTTTLIPAFVISELRTAFQMGFLIYLPFIVIDLVVASILMSLGMVMLPPAMIALPIKLLMFVLADGWGLIVETLVASFGSSGVG